MHIMQSKWKNMQNTFSAARRGVRERLTLRARELFRGGSHAALRNMT
jgi:hypothetical protein